MDTEITGVYALEYVPLVNNDCCWDAKSVYQSNVCISDHSLFLYSTTYRQHDF